MADDIIDRLLKLQEQDLLIQEQEQEMTQLPLRSKNLENDLLSHRTAITESEAQRQNLQLAVKQAELDIETQRQKMARLREQQLTLKTNREFRAMDDEIATIEGIIGNHETRLLEAMEAVDQATAEIKTRKSELAQAEDQVAREQASLKERLRQIEEQADIIRQKRESVAQHIPVIWLQVYDRLFKGRRDRVLVTVDNGTCGGCHIKLAPAKTHAARRSESMVTCDFCGRMLYSSERMT